jgi:hypothetical protein
MAVGVGEMAVGVGFVFGGEAEGCWQGAVPPLDTKARITSRTIRTAGFIERIENASVRSAGTRTCRGSAVVALAVGEPQKPLFNNRVAPVPQLWLLSITPILTVVSVEEFVERGRLEKLRKPKPGCYRLCCLRFFFLSARPKIASVQRYAIGPPGYWVFDSRKKTR